MSNHAKIQALPLPIRKQLVERLRAAEYGQHNATSAWLAEQGFPITAFGVKTFAKDLRVTDEAREELEAPIIGTPVGLMSRDEILTELAQLTLRQMSLIERLLIL